MMLERRLRRSLDRTRPPAESDDLEALASALDEIERGTLSSAALLVAPLLYRAYCAGHAKGHAAASNALADLQRRLDVAEHDADRWYERANNPGRKLARMRERRIAEALDEAFWEGRLRTLADDVEVAVRAATPPARTAPRSTRPAA